MDDLMTVMEWYLNEDEHEQFLDELDLWKTRSGCFSDDAAQPKKCWSSEQTKLNACKPHVYMHGCCVCSCRVHVNDVHGVFKQVHGGQDGVITPRCCAKLH